MSAETGQADHTGKGLLFAVLGAGSWGTALSMQLHRAGSRAVLWDIDQDHLAAMQRSGRNEKFLPDFPLPDGLLLESDLEAAVGSADEILIVVPSHAFVGTLKRIQGWLEPGLRTAARGTATASSPRRRRSSSAVMPALTPWAGPRRSIACRGSSGTP